MFITLSVLLFSLQHKAICFTVSTTRSNKDIKLVNLLKQDLRINNDDYIDKLNNSKLLPAFNKQSGADNLAKTNVKQQNTDKLMYKHVGKDANRRNIDFSDEVNYNKYSYSPEASVVVPTINPKRFQKVMMTTKYDSNAQKPTVPDDRPQHVNKPNADKLKQFIGRNKELLQEFINKKREEARTVAMPTLDASPEEAPAAAPRAWASAELGARVPAARQLDMAPAKGGKIHSLRLKGRLCERSVLIPEGPKYDSKGHVYLQAYTPQGRDKDYVNTKPPRLVLPKCCNCCRKSVLGCE